MSENLSINQKSPLHYAWIICLTGVAVLFSCLGLGRFSLGMLLPAMGSSLALNYSQMGLISTGNFTGYMVAVFLAGIIAKRIGARRTIFSGLLLVGLSMTAICRAQNFYTVLALYFLTGIGSGLANVPMMGLVSHWFLKDTRGRAAGFMLSGNGLAIIFSGMFIPFVNSQFGSEGWRTGWLVIGVISLFISIIALVLLRNAPKEMGVSPLGRVKAAQKPSFRPKRDDATNNRTMIHLGCIYAFFGATYVVYATFIVTAMINEYGFGESAAGSFWAIVGGLSLVSGPLFGGLSDRIGRKKGIILVYALFTVSYLLVASGLSNTFLYLSIGIFGLAVWSIPTIMSAAVGDYMGPEKAVKAFGFITLFFGAGQIAGPALAGMIADKTGTFSPVFFLCALLTATAAILTFFLKPPPSTSSN